MLNIFKKYKWPAVAGLALLLGLIAWKARSCGKDETTYERTTVERGDLKQTTLANGTVQPQNRLEIKPPIPGRIESILVREGDAVTQGQILAWLSSTERATLLDAARAKGPQEVAHWEELFKPTPLIAPLTGLLIVRNVEPGQVVTAQDPVLVLSDHLIVRVQVDETDIARVQKGQAATIRLEAYPDQKIEGIVDSISFESTVVNNVTIYEVDVRAETIPGFMRSGMSAEVEFLIEHREGVLTVPSSAVKKDKSVSYVQIALPKSGKPQRRDVRTGLSDGKKIEILEGLHEGETVLIESYKRPGAKGPAAVNPLSPMPRGRTR